MIIPYASISSTVLPLVGVVLGASASIIGQYLVTRTTAQQARASRAAALRAERKEAIQRFLDTAQDAARLAEDRHVGGELPDDAPAVTHNMWLLQKSLDLVASPQLRHAAVDFCWRLHEAVYRELPGDKNVWDFIDERQRPFIEAARRELDIPDLDPPTTGGQ